MKVNKLLESLRKGKNGDWEKEGYKLKHVPHQGGDESYFEIHAFDPSGNKIGHADFTHHDSKHIRSYDDGLSFDNAHVSVKVNPDHRRKGLASAMYQFAEQSTGKKLKNIGKNKRTTDGQALWSQPNRPFSNNNKLDKAMKNDNENTVGKRHQELREKGQIKEPPTLDYKVINKIKPTPAPTTLDYSAPDMKRDPKKDPNWKQGADKAKMAQHTKNNPNIIKGINDQHYVMPPKALDKSAEYDKEVNDKIAKLKEKYADKTPKTMEQKVAEVKDRYSKLKPAQLPEINQHIVAKDQLAAARDKHKTSKVLNHLKTLKEKAKSA